MPDQNAQPLRTPLPPRRPAVTLERRWQGHVILISVGFDLSGEPREVFVGTSGGGHMAAVLADACVVVSVALQHGIPSEALARSLGRVPVPWVSEGASEPASPVGVIFEAIEEARP